MPNMEKLLRLVKEASSRTARIQTFAAKMSAEPEHTDKYTAVVLSSYLEIAIENLRSAQEMAAYLARPVRETSRLWRNGSGQYETTAGFLFREGSPIEVLVPDKYRSDSSHWERTYLRYDGRDYYLADHADLPLEGRAVRVREGDQP